MADILKEVKGATSHLVTHEIAPTAFFKWQGSYGAFTVSKEAVPQVEAYIRQQSEHHTGGSLVAAWERTVTDEVEQSKASRVRPQPRSSPVGAGRLRAPAGGLGAFGCRGFNRPAEAAWVQFIGPTYPGHTGRGLRASGKFFENQSYNRSS